MPHRAPNRPRDTDAKRENARDSVSKKAAVCVRPHTHAAHSTVDDYEWHAARDADADAEMTAFACATEGCFDSDSDDGELLAAA